MWQLTELVILNLSYNKDLTGTISPSINNLKKLTSLVLVDCNFYGSIVDTIGSIENLIKLSLNSNGFTGEIPSSLGNLLNLDWLGLADNKLSGAIPVSSGTIPGLDMMIRAKHFHFRKNRLSGSIPAKLFHPNMILKHVLFDNNQLSDSIPATVGLLPQLEVLRLDRNSLSGHVPHLGELADLNEMLGPPDVIQHTPNCPEETLTREYVQSGYKETVEGLEIAAAASKLAECQATIYHLGRQLKALNPMTEPNDLRHSKELQMD